MIIIEEPKIITHKYTLEATCPNCNKEVKAIKISREKITLTNTRFENAFHILGCPECKNVFYQEEVNGFVKDYMESK